VSPWLIAALVLAAVLAGVVIMVAVWRADWDFLALDPNRAAGVFSFVGLSFTVLLAFIILVAYTSYNDATVAAEAEAQAVFEASTSAEAFKGPPSDALEGGLICYGRAVINQEWEAMRDGDRSPVVDRWDTFLRHRALALETGEGVAQQTAFAQILDESDARADGRRGRLVEAAGVITGPIWMVLALGALLTIGSVLFFKERSESQIVQGALMGVVAAMVAAGLVLVWFLDHPYTGNNGSIEPTEMEHAVTAVQRQHPDVVPPCDATGA
jgi:hypothetical protein